MANGEINRLLEIANLQMAAEAFLARANDPTPNQPPPGEILDRLVKGNTHASHFTAVQAQQFTDQYEVLAQYRNDPQLAEGTGFSGTLFRNKSTGELTLSFRSTEFIDDTVRDNLETNRLEIKDLGWAFGQISEMEAWYSELSGSGGPLEGKTFNVTGYSLGGHLATAFNILRREEAEANGTPNPVLATYTFNGAGTGAIRGGRHLTDLLADFNQIRQDYRASPQWNALSPSDQISIRNAAEIRVQALGREQARVAGLSGVANEAFGGATAPVGVQASMDYQVAALLAGRSAVKASNFPLPGGVNYIPFRPKFASSLGLQGFDNMIEVVGSDSGNLGPSFVSNSGIHYGSRQEIYIEDQPGTRGAFPLQVLLGFNLLVNNPAQNDFADTHSLVLLVDSLSLLAAMETLDPEFTIEAAKEILSVESSAKASTEIGTQGRAEGDTLERTLDALRDLILGPGQEPTVDYAETLDGNTWHVDDLRRPFQENLAGLSDAIGELTEENDFIIQSLAETDSEDLAAAALEPDAIAYRYALTQLNPFAVVGDRTDAPLYDQHNMAGELDLYDAEDGSGSLTETWIEDRAELLAWKNLYYQKDGNVALRSEDIETRQFVDKSIVDDVTGSELTLTVVGRQLSAINTPSKIIFGGGEADSLVGGDIAVGDHLYGGGGNDTLQGKQGDDYLEGGDGNDTYIWNAGDDFDTILDTDGVGKLVVDGVAVSGGIQIAQNDYISLDRKFLFHLDNTGTRQTLLVNGDIGIENFKNGDLGITLNDAEGIQQVQPTTSIFLVPYHPWSSTIGFGTDGEDFAVGSTSIFVSKGGDDLLQVEDGFGEFDAGPGNDVILGGADQGDPSASSLFFLGSGSDIGIGGDGNDDFSGDEPFLLPSDDAFLTLSFSYSSGEGYWGWDVQTFREIDFDGAQPQLFQGTAEDALRYVFGITGEGTSLASSSDDYIDGGGGSDRILGGSGSDTLLGGDGDDFLTGDGFALISERPQAPIPAWLVDWLPYLYAPGDDYLDGGPGNDVLGDDSSRFPLDSMGGSDVLIGGDGNDVLTNIDPRQDEHPYVNVLDGGSGNDTLTSNNQSLNGFDTLIGGAGDDNLTIGDSGNGRLDGGAGNDSLTVGIGTAASMEGGAGGDFYLATFMDPIFSPVRTSGTLEIGEVEDNGTESDFLSVNVVAFSDVSVSITRDETNLYIGATGQPRWLTISDWFQGNGHKIEIIGITINRVGGTSEALFYDVPAIESLFMTATAADDSLWGSGESEQLSGGLGNDTLIAGDGDDTLDGGEGSDTLDGGKGADRYVFRLGDGVDRIADSDGIGNNGISFGEGISPTMLSMDFDTLTLKVGEGGDAIRLGATDSTGGGLAAIGYLQFSDGSILPFQDFLGQSPEFVSDSDEVAGGSDAGGGPSAGELPGGGSENAGGIGQGSGDGAPVASTGGRDVESTAGSTGNLNADDIFGATPPAPGNPGTDPIFVWWPDGGNQVGKTTSNESGLAGNLPVQDTQLGQRCDSAYGQFPASNGLGSSSYKHDGGWDAVAPRSRNDLSAQLEAYLADESRFDFEVPESRTKQDARNSLTPTPAKVAERWTEIDRYMKALAENDDEDAQEGAGEYRMFDNWNLVTSGSSDGVFGFAGSTGATRGMANMTTFSGLSEGFTRLTA